MARIRTIKPDFWDSPATGKASLRARLLFIAMWNWADDFGIGDAHSGRLWNFAFPNDDPPEMIVSGDSADIPPTFRRIPPEYAEIANLFEVIFYEHEGRPYYYIPSWSTHQKLDRRSVQKVPYPDENTPALFVDIPRPPKSHRNPPTSHRNPPTSHRNVGVGTEELGTEELGTEELNSSSGFSHENPRPTKRADVQEILDYLDQHLREADLPIPNRTKHNQSAARLLIDKDGHSVQEIKAAIDWTFRDEFWRTNIRSASKLREKWGQLKGAAQRQAAKQQRASPMPLSRSDQLYMAEMQRLKTEETQSLQLERRTT